MNIVKKILLTLWSLPFQVRFFLRLGYWLGNSVPIIGFPLSIVLDRFILLFYGLDCYSSSIHVAEIKVSHPHGVLLGGNGIRSDGLLIINGGVKFIGNNPDDPKYLKLHAEQRVFDFGENIMFGTGCVVVGPRKICSNVAIGTMSVVRHDILESGVYAGNPARLVNKEIPKGWFDMA